MSAPLGCIDDKVVIERFKDALNSRVGADRFGLWFGTGVSFQVQRSSAVESSGNGITGGQIVVRVNGQFAADRITKQFMSELRGAASEASEHTLSVRISVAAPAVQQPLVPDPQVIGAELTGPAASPVDPAGLGSAASRGQRRVASQRSAPRAGSVTRPAGSIATLFDLSVQQRRPARRGAIESVGSAAGPTDRQATIDAAATDATTRSSIQPGDGVAGSAGPVAPSDLTQGRGGMTIANFIGGSCNRLALTAAQMACKTPATASPLFLYGPTGVGKSHLLHALADQFRRLHRLKRVTVLSAEHFTNDFIGSVGTSGLAAFRRRYRDVDALLIDDIQFIAAKKATLRELLYTIETLITAGRPLVFSANQSPGEIDGLTMEVVGRLTSGLVCPMQALCSEVRIELMRRLIAQRCPYPWPEELIIDLGGRIDGDGRGVSGAINLVGTLQRMYGRMPTLQEIQTFGGDLFRHSGPTVTLAAIERAVCRVFDLQDDALRGGNLTRTVSEPRMLAMYLSRQMTTSAFSEISQHYGGRSHSTAIAANRKVADWLAAGKPIGRGPAAVGTREALQRIEQMLRTG